MADNDGDELEYTIEPPDEIPSTMIKVAYCRPYEPSRIRVIRENPNRPVKKKKKKKEDGEDLPS
jgi:hypothetical protein